MKIVCFLGLLCILLFLSMNKREALTIQVDTDVIHKYAFVPAYRALLGLVPFKYQYRKVRQYFKSS
jgi:hypothetical protein